MNQFLTLLKVNLKVTFGGSGLESDKSKNTAIKVVAGLALVFLSVVLCVSMYFMAANITSELLPSLISTMMLSVEVFIIFIGAAQYVSVLFFSKDTEFLMALPVKSNTIFCSKFMTVYLSHLVISLCMLVPVIITIGIACKIGSAWYYLLGLFGAVLVPFIPLFIVSLIAFPLVYVVSYFKRNNGMGAILMTLLFVGFFGAYMYVMMTVSSGTDISGSGMMDGIKVTGNIMYPNMFLAWAMVGSGIDILSNLAIFLSIIIGAGIVSILMSTLLYRKLSTRFLEVGVDSRKIKKRDNERTAPMKALIIRDLKCAFGESSMSFNYVVGLVMAPVIMVVFSLMDFGGGEGADVFDMGNYFTSMSSGMVFPMLIGANYFAIIAFSREGKSFGILKMMPLTSQDIIRSKMLIADSYIVIGAVICGITQIFLGVNWLAILLFVITVIIFGMGINALAMERDLNSPKMHWNNLKELMKGNMSAMIPSLVSSSGMMLLIIAGAITTWVPALSALPEEVQSVIMYLPSLLLGIIYYVVFRVLRFNKTAAFKLDKLE